MGTVAQHYTFNFLIIIFKKSDLRLETDTVKCNWYLSRMPSSGAIEKTMQQINAERQQKKKCK